MIPHYVYIFANRDQTKIPRRTKIGFSRTPMSRLKSFKPEKIVYRGFEDLYLYGVYVYKEGSERDARDLEFVAHKYFKKHQCKERGFKGATEIFDIQPEFVERFLLQAGARKLPPDDPMLIEGI
ncbi:putative endonuclease [Salmonella phage CRW-SP5]|uniref:Endonuclease n=1 Tax=Salmonella phage PRF-SP13 TaxID=3025418 RepID=A0AAF0BT60_9CAUD|nr:GIY-YIG nuclease family protein [Salmonella enterica subsp. enterica]WCO82213.1 putative endonuclease [Salmonella phage PRF-SP13]WNO24832.1 putative endonuclease [Salmonella phage PRF-SP12]WPJ68855.1 hypothetical protein NHPHFPKK_00162 [Salmonella phage STP-SP9]WPJ72456.1 putative endonuclease [Salmonella phage CRW-SP5]WPJ72610.1 putative endonuclease [Salmonella phage CRW-SP6]